MDFIYDEFWTLQYSDVSDKVTQKEWMITQMYFNNWYTADHVISQLKSKYIF
jgi:lipopolysaccharide biosynthesis protein